MITSLSTSGLQSEFWQEIRARVSRIQEITESQGISGTYELLASTKQLINLKSVDNHIDLPSSGEVPSPHPFNDSKHIRRLDSSSLDSSFSSEVAINTIFTPTKSQFLRFRFDEEITHIKEEATTIHGELKLRLNAFRKATQGFSTMNDKAQAELEWYKEEMTKLKRSINQVLEETHQTKLELAKARETISSLNNKEKQFELKDLEFSPDRGIKKEFNYSFISDKIIELYKEINEINEKVIETDETRCKLERENQTLKDVVMKLQDSVTANIKSDAPIETLQLEDVIYIQKEKDCSCHMGCVIF